MRKELTLAKNIIKNPILLKKAEQATNFHRLEVYTIKNSQDEIEKRKKAEKKRNMFESFNFNDDGIRSKHKNKIIAYSKHIYKYE